MPKQEEDTGRVEGAIFEFLKKADAPKTEPEIEAGVKSKTTVKRSALRSLVEKGRIIRTGKGARTQPYLYSICSDSCSHDPHQAEQSSNEESGVPSYAAVGGTGEQESRIMLLARQTLERRRRTTILQHHSYES